MTSTSEVYGTAQVTPIREDHPLHGQSPHAAGKIAADVMTEAYVRSFDLPEVVLRPFNTYVSRGGLLRQAKGEAIRRRERRSGAA